MAQQGTEGKYWVMSDESSGSEPDSSFDTDEEADVVDTEECCAILDSLSKELADLKYEDESESSESEEEDLLLDTECVNDLIAKIWKWCDEWDLQCRADIKLKDVEHEVRLMAGDYFIKKKSIVHE